MKLIRARTQLQNRESLFLVPDETIECFEKKYGEFTLPIGSYILVSEDMDATGCCTNDYCNIEIPIILRQEIFDIKKEIQKLKQKLNAYNTKREYKDLLNNAKENEKQLKELKKEKDDLAKEIERLRVLAEQKGEKIKNISDKDMEKLEKVNLVQVVQRPFFSDVIPNVRKVVKIFTTEHAKSIAKIYNQNQKIASSIQQMVFKEGIEAVIIDAQLSLDCQRLDIIYEAPAYIDYRELVKKIAKKYKARVQMKQVFQNERTKYMTDYGCCGNLMCCKSMDLQHTCCTIQDAKMQISKTRLNDTKGHCMKVPCCMSFEKHIYEIAQEIGKPGDILIIDGKKHKIVEVDALKQEVHLVEKQDQDKRKIENNEPINYNKVIKTFSQILNLK